jgi:hypothetical protein
LSNLTLEITLSADNLAEDTIDYENLRYSRSRLGPVAASAAEDDMMVVIEVVIVTVAVRLILGIAESRVLVMESVSKDRISLVLI